MKRLMFTISLFGLILFSSIDILAQLPQQDNIERELMLYPNPTDGPLHVDFKSESRVKPTANILDITGKQVKQFSADLLYSDGQFSADITVTDLKPGIYFVKFEQLQKVLLKKIIVK